MIGDAVDHGGGCRETHTIRSRPGRPKTTPVIVVRLPSIQRMTRNAKQPPAASSVPVLTPTNPSCPRRVLVLCESSNWTLGPFLDLPKHLLAHHEAEHLGELDDEPRPRSRVRVSLTHEQTRRLVRLVSEHKRPGEVVWGRRLPDRNAATKNERPSVVQRGHG